MRWASVTGPKEMGENHRDAAACSAVGQASSGSGCRIRSGGRHIASDHTASDTFGRMRTWLATTTVLLVAACDPSPGPDACYGVCGEGTQCEAKECVVATVELPEPEPEPTSGKKKKRRRGRKGSPSSKSDGPDFKAEDDSNVPGYDAKAAKGLDMNAGTDRLGDRTIRQHLSRLEPKFNKCIEKSALAHADGLKGELDFVLSIQPSGKVGGVTVKASGNLKQAGVVPCARKVVYGHRFPSFDGSTMGVDYSFKVD